MTDAPDTREIATPSCPSCGHRELSAYPSCHTWGGDADGKGWMACLGCFSAFDYSCNECDWHYTHGLNPRNPRSLDNETRRPTWIVGDFNERLADGFEMDDYGYRTTLGDVQ